MKKLTGYCPHFSYAKINETSKYYYQHQGFFPVKQHKKRLGIWIGNNNYYPESEIKLFAYEKNQGFFQFANLCMDKENRNYYIAELKEMNLDIPLSQDHILRDHV